MALDKGGSMNVRTMMRRMRRMPLALVLVAISAALFASAASANTGFEAKSYPATLSGEGGESTVSMPGLGSLICEDPDFGATLNGASESLMTSSVKDGACLYGGGHEAIKMNGCNLRMLPEPVTGKGFEHGTFEVGPPGCGPIDFYFWGLPCSEVSPQVASASNYSVRNLEGGAVEVESELILEAKEAGFCGKETGSLVWDPSWKVSAKDAGGSADSLSFNQELKLAPALQAEKYSASLAGGGFEKFAFKTGTLSCPKTGLHGTLAGSSSSVNLEAEYSECTLKTGESTLNATVQMRSCHYTLGVQNSGPPYKGSWGVACNEAGDSIRLNVTILGSQINCFRIYPQSGLTGPSLANVGSWSGRGVELSGEVTGVKYELKGACGSSETFSDGVMSGKATLTGTNSGSADGVYLVGKGP
jgi:hypothetical protein